MVMLLIEFVGFYLKQSEKMGRFHSGYFKSVGYMSVGKDNRNSITFEVHSVTIFIMAIVVLDCFSFNNSSQVVRFGLYDFVIVCKITASKHNRNCSRTLVRREVMMNIPYHTTIHHEYQRAVVFSVHS